MNKKNHLQDYILNNIVVSEDLNIILNSPKTIKIFINKKNISCSEYSGENLYVVRTGEEADSILEFISNNMNEFKGGLVE